MSRNLLYNKDYKCIGQEIESMDICKWLINDICCNDKSDALEDYPYPRSICENKYGCGCFEKEDGIVEEEKQ